MSSEPGAGQGGGHLSERLLNTVLADLQKPGHALNVVQQFSNQAFRAWFKTHTRRLGYSKIAQKLVLDHSEGRERDVTDLHYDWEQGLPEKFAILSAWEKLIIDKAHSTYNSVTTPRLFPSDSAYRAGDIIKLRNTNLE